ncbi:hypothetical protein GPECTOR_82g233 [Gonium pectorale]|uniref:Uncharacterized protein n=1 Tax=Gonium pectorale TaxID=33097 RepID=A0A150G1E9_GONPE|nr:hypothetical protein GPECTOR_82g233 [Gonium pectorale]|eukprot:KXZ43699.1 hypothetical protein GPECTOR_82g233 [Gonium pectorale]
MFGTQNKTCPFCHRRLPAFMYIFCSNECQRCWHRANGSAPSGMSRSEFVALCRKQKDWLDEHERKVRSGEWRG